MTEPVPQPRTDETAAATGEAVALDLPSGEAEADTIPAGVRPGAAAAGEAPAEAARPRRRTVFIAYMRRVVALAVAVAIFAAGVALGYRIFDGNRPAATAVNPIEQSAPPPAVAQEFIRALAANDMDALRSSLEMQPHRDITDEMTRFGIHKVARVETLKTEVDGTRSATGIMIMAENTEGLAFGVNLVILVQDGKIEGFR